MFSTWMRSIAIFHGPITHKWERAKTEGKAFFQATVDYMLSALYYLPLLYVACISCLECIIANEN